MDLYWTAIMLAVGIALYWLASEQEWI